MEGSNRFGYPRTGEERNALATIIRFVSRWVRRSARDIQVMAQMLMLQPSLGEGLVSSVGYGDLYAQGYERAVLQRRSTVSDQQVAAAMQSLDRTPSGIRRAQYTRSQLYQMPDHTRLPRRWPDYHVDGQMQRGFPVRQRFFGFF